MKKIVTWAMLFCIAGSAFIACSSSAGASPPPATPLVSADASNVTPTLASGLTINLTGGATVDGNAMAGGTYNWTTKSAPAGATPSFGDSTMANTTVTDLKKAGIYVFELKATSAAGVAGVQTVTVTVAPITKNITIPAITAVVNPLEFGAVSALTGWDADFPSTDVTYTLTLSQGGTTITTVDSTSSTSISASAHANGMYTLTQTFYYDNSGSPVNVGSRSAGISISGGVFGGIAVSETELVPGSFTEVTLILSKDTID